MKKTLLATSALAFAGAMAAGQAVAADKLSVSLGGYMEQWVGMTNLDNGDGGIGVWSDTEFNVRGSLEADNGLKFSVKIEVEGNGGGDIDESQATVSGSFGQIVIGAEDDVVPLMHKGHQDVGIGLNHGDVGWISGISTGGTNGWVADAKRISYYTPRMAGVQLGMSYAPDMNSESKNIGPVNNDMSAWGIAANVTQSVGDANVAFSVGHHAANGGAEEHTLFDGRMKGDRGTVAWHKAHAMNVMNWAKIMAGTHVLQNGATGMNPVNTPNILPITRIKPGEDATNVPTAVVGTVANAKLAAETSMKLLKENKMMAMSNKDFTFTNIGLQVGFGAVSLNVAYAEKDSSIMKSMTSYMDVMGTPTDMTDDVEYMTLVDDPSADSEVTTVGVKYSDGPMAASLGYLLNENGAGMETEAVMASFQYTLAPGVNSKTSIFQADDGMDSGTGFVTGITIGF